MIILLILSPIHNLLMCAIKVHNIEEKTQSIQYPMLESMFKFFQHLNSVLRPGYSIICN